MDPYVNADIQVADETSGWEECPQMGLFKICSIKLSYRNEYSIQGRCW